MQQLITALKESDHQAVSTLIQYPLGRQLPLTELKTPDEFISHFNEYFGPESSKSYIPAIKKDIRLGNIRGTTGIVFQKGKIIKIPETPQYFSALRKAKEIDTAGLHPSAKGYDKIEYECDSRLLHVRIETFGDIVKFFSWKRGSTLSSVPETAAIANRELLGSAANIQYLFSAKGDTYDFWQPTSLCTYQERRAREDGCRATLTIKRAENIVLEDFCD